MGVDIASLCRQFGEKRQFEQGRDRGHVRLLLLSRQP
jgi:hypothetical protein